MARPKTGRPTDLELEILKALWERGPSTVREVREALFGKRPMIYTTVLKMLALVEGLMPFAAKHAFIYRREAGTVSKNEIPIELQKIIERKSPDVHLEASDILYIPDNKGRRMTVTTLERIAGFGTATASGLLIWRR